MSAANEKELVDKTLNMKNWAVVGATDNKDKFGYKIYQRFKEYGYNVFAVNPSLDQIDGDKCYDSIKDIEANIDAVDMVVNKKIALEVLKDVKDKNIEYVWLQPGSRSQKIRDFAAEYNIKLIPRCVYKELYLKGPL